MQGKIGMKKRFRRLVIASTTSTQNSGLFDVLIPAFEKASVPGLQVEVVAVGTGQAIRIAKKGGVDLLFVHDPFREEKFVAEGYGVNRRRVMHNDFVILGSKRDPARIKGHESAVDAFELIAEKRAPFVSRGDDSGTNAKELDIWDDAGVNPKGKGWYLEAGTKMGDALMMADAKKAYILSDRGTFLNYASRIGLRVLCEGDSLLKNQYSVIAVSPAKFPGVRYREAMEFIAFVTSAGGQELIARYKKHGISLFNPDAVPVTATKSPRKKQ
jgi:tungstate transport system substrate-binding protein